MTLGGMTTTSPLVVVGHWSFGDYMSDERYRDWTLLVYPDSAPGDWIKLLQNQFLCFCISPLHEPELDREGEYKPHWHIIISYGGKKSYDQVRFDTMCLNGTIPKRVKNKTGLIQYLVHLNNPEKPKYKIQDIQSFYGFDKFVDEAFKLARTDINTIMSDMQDFIISQGIKEYRTLWEYSANMPHWRYVLNMYNCNSINRLINSMRYDK